MAWYLSEVVADLSPIKGILTLYSQINFFDEESFHHEHQSRLASYLRQVTFNSDHIDTDTIPSEYENDEYKWLASGYHDLILKLGLVEQHSDSQQYGYELTDLGNKLAKQTTTIHDVMKLKLPEWKNDRGISPYQEIKKVISTLKQVNLYPCNGLLLLEMMIVMQWINSTPIYSDPYNQIYKQRKAYYAHMVGVPSIDLIRYSDFLWEVLSDDLTNYFAANYPTRATLQLMMYARELTFGQVPDEIFGQVQYITMS